MNQSLIEFPCQFTIKVMGKANDEYEQFVLSSVAKHFPDCKKNKVKRKLSKQGNYLALDIEVNAKSQLELDGLYITLSKNPLVLMCL